MVGEQISERGIGNGISLIIATSIITGVPRAFGQALEQTQQGDLNYLILIVLGLLHYLLLRLLFLWKMLKEKLLSIMLKDIK